MILHKSCVQKRYYFCIHCAGTTHIDVIFNQIYARFSIITIMKINMKIDAQIAHFLHN